MTPRTPGAGLRLLAALACVLTAATAAGLSTGVWVQRHPGVDPSARWDAVLTYDAQHGGPRLFGGWAGGTDLIVGGLSWDGADWVVVAECTVPGPRHGLAAQIDGTGLGMLFGGFDTALLDETWLHSSSGWTMATPSSRPSARSYHAVASYVVAGSAAVLFGGRNASGALGGTWLWNGSNWTQVCTVGCESPSPRAGHAMVWDDNLGQVVIFGGEGSAPLGDTWEFDGGGWEPTATTGPSPRSGHAMAYDPGRRRVVLFGGTTGSAETWEYYTVGQTCTGGSTCDTGFCADAYCCDQPCDSPCQTCAGTTLGRCEAVRDAVDADRCAGDHVCDALGQCRLIDGQSCDGDGQCRSTSFCDASRTCRPQVAIGASCSPDPCYQPGCQMCDVLGCGGDAPACVAGSCTCLQTDGGTPQDDGGAPDGGTPDGGGPDGGAPDGGAPDGGGGDAAGADAAADGSRSSTSLYAFQCRAASGASPPVGLLLALLLARLRRRR